MTGDERAMRVWLADDEPSAAFPLYTRGNVGEVFPTVVSPLTWTLFGEAAERGWRDGFNRFGAFVPADYGEEPMVTLGVFGGYCYINMSVVRIFAVRTPGLTVPALDHTFFGEAEAPPYTSRKGDKDARASLRVGRTLLRTLRAKSLPELEAAKAETARWMRSLAPVESSSDAELLTLIRGWVPTFRWLFGMHILTTFQATVGPGLLQQLTTKVGEPDAVPTLLGGIGDVESAAPSTQLWDMGRMVADDPQLSAAFDRGVEEVDALPESFRDALGRFLGEHGSRGPNEWEGSSATWGTKPALVLAAIDRMRLTSPEHDPRVQQAALAAHRADATASVRARLNRVDRMQFDMALRSSILFSQGRERSKTTIIRALHEIRLRQRELARRASERGGTRRLEDMWLLRLEELEDYQADPPKWVDELGARAQLRDTLTDLVPPFIFDRHQPATDTWERRDASESQVRAGDELRGIAGCPGIARGRARVVLDPLDPRGLAPGEVLVAPITDPSWTPLFVAAEAVVVDVGAQMSHAVIVSRELGIPAVVSVTGATRRIPDGAMLEVDGTRGVVRVLAV